MIWKCDDLLMRKILIPAFVFHGIIVASQSFIGISMFIIDFIDKIEFGL